MREYFIGVDNGGTHARAAMYDKNGVEMAVILYPTELLTPQPGFTERDLEEFWQATAKCIKDVMEKTGVKPNQVACVACCGHGKGLYLLDKEGKPLYNGIISTDTRAHKYISMWNSDGTAEKAREKTCQNIMVSQPCAILRWLKDNEPMIYEKIGYILEAKDYIRYRLTGEAFCEFTDSSGTSLVNMYTREYDKELFDLFGISEMADKVPPLKSALDVCGYITKETAAICGLEEGIPVAGGMFDIDACAIASGVTDETNICVIAGTWSMNEYISKTPVTNGTAAMNSIFCMPEFYLIEESSPTSAGNLEWLAKNVFDTVRENAINDNKSIYKEFDKMAAECDENADIYFLPYVFGSQDHALARGTFIGMTSQTTKAQLVRATLEGIVFNHRMHCEKLFKSREDHPAKCIRLAGGAAHSPFWVQMFADILKYPIEITLSNELGTLGCAINGAVTSGVYKDLKDAADHMVHVGDTINPNKEMEAIYDRKYNMFVKIVKTLYPLWDSFDGN